MTTKSNDRQKGGLEQSALNDPIALAIAILSERVRGLPDEDKEDLYKITKELFSSDPEEVDNARIAFQEILDQTRGSLNVVPLPDGPGEELTWHISVGNQIKHFRESAGMTQEELSTASGIPQSHVSRLENGKHSPSFFTLEKLATAMGIDVAKLSP